jgi:hypothetical protein
MTRFVGIDLGTTHIAVATATDGEVESFPLAQLVGPNLADNLPLLPSVLFAVEPGSVAPDDVHEGFIAGEFALNRAAETVGHAVVSSKSWLAFAGVDRTAAILPWRAEEEDGPRRISPVDAARLLLAHVARAWDAAHPNEPLAKQTVVLTVPASFDAAARELTIRAARAIGLSPTLLEEPQAAFLDWAENPEAFEAALPRGESEGRVLVVDVGGGTTDLSMFRICRENAGFSLERVAVGRHLLLGGDNMDLTLAYACERRLMGEERLPPRRFAELTAACRRAKERLLAVDGPESVTVSLLGQGSKLLGSTTSTTLERADVDRLLTDGFFPRVDAGAEPIRSRAAVVAFGLPFERDVAITRHVASFCRKHGTPTALLLNGGVFHARPFALRLHEVVASFGAESVALLPATRPDVAVARGAVRYALGQAGRGPRVRAGATRSYYVGIGDGEAVCVLPIGSEDGVVHRTEQRFELTLGETVQFSLLAREAHDPVGARVHIDASFDALPPLVAALAGSGSVEVVLEARLSAIGTLELACVASDGRRDALSFELGARAERRAAFGGRASKRLELASLVLEHVYGKGSSASEREVKDLFRELERLLGKREAWDGELCRGLTDKLLAVHKGRRQSRDHERIFWQLAGYTLRPGVGSVRDPERVARLFDLFSSRLAHPETRSWQAFWIAWRRVAAGLDEAMQGRMRDVLDPELAPAELKRKRDKGFRNEATFEMLELAASLERLSAPRRGELGSWIVERTWTCRDPRLWAALGRVGGRIPVYGSVHQVVRAATVERWLDHLVREKWDLVPTAPAAALAMCRLTGDRERDVAERTRILVDKKLASLGLGAPYRAPLHDVVPLQAEEHSAFFGEELPSGLRLASH